MLYKIAYKIRRFLPLQWMLEPVRRRLRAWILAGDPVAPATPDLVLNCWIDGRLVRVLAVGAVGLRLRVRTAKGETLVDHRSATNPDAFWAAWKRLSPSANLRWEDGQAWYAATPDQPFH